MRFDGLDLNLLVALDTMLETQSVSKSAIKLNMTQPALSAALNRLRAFFDDDLLRHVGRSMVPTQRGRELAGPIKRSLMQIRAEITRSGTFDPGTAQRHFRIAASDCMNLVFLTKMIADMAKTAPLVTFEILRADYNAEVAMTKGEIDLYITSSRFADERRPTTTLWHHDNVVISWIGAGYDEIDEATYASAGHVEAFFGHHRHSELSKAYITKLDTNRRVELLLPSFSEICPSIIGTRRLGTMWTCYAEYFAKLYPIRLHKPWREFPIESEVAQWNESFNQDSSIQWLLGCLTSLGDDLPDRYRVQRINP